MQDGGDRHLEFFQICISDVIDMFQIEISMFSQILVTIGQIVKKWQHFFAIQDGGGGYTIFIGFSRPRGGKSHFPYRKAYGLYNSAMRYRAGL